MKDYQAICMEISFKPDHILRAEMLEEVYNFPHRLARNYYREYGDGIINGFSIIDESGDLIVDTGIIKLTDEISIHKNLERFYFLNNQINLTKMFNLNTLESGLYQIGLIKAGRKDKHSCTVNTLKFKCEKVENNPEFLLLLGEFRKDEDTAVILPKISEDNLRDHSIFIQMGGNAIFSVLKQNYSCLHGITYPPYVFEILKKSLSIKPEKDYLDIALLMQLQNNEVLSLDTVKMYIELKGGTINDDRVKLFMEFGRVIGNSTNISTKSENYPSTSENITKSINPFKGEVGW